MASGSVIRYEGPRGVVFRIKYRDADGRQVMETTGPDEKEAQRVLRHRLTDVERDDFRKPEKIAFGEFAERFWTYLPGRNLKTSTALNYRSSIRRHLAPFFGCDVDERLPGDGSLGVRGGRELAEISTRPELIDRYVAAKTREGLAPKTIANTLTDLNVMLRQAIRWRMIRHNPLADAERPRLQPAEMNVLTEAEIARLLVAYRELAGEADEQERPWWELTRRVVAVALGTALRRGELLGLRWRDVELLERRLSVRQAYVRGEFTTPKSKTSRRTIELGPRMVAVLEEQLRSSRYQGDDELVFGHPLLGTPLDPSKLSRKYLRPALRRAAITKPFRPFHDVRHTALTHEAAAGNPQAYVQLKAGHSQGSITERYIHAAQVLFEGAAARGEDRMFGELDPGRESVES